MSSVNLFCVSQKLSSTKLIKVVTFEDMNILKALEWQTPEREGLSVLEHGNKHAINYDVGKPPFCDK